MSSGVGMRLLIAWLGNCLGLLVATAAKGSRNVPPRRAPAVSMTATARLAPNIAVELDLTTECSAARG